MTPTHEKVEAVAAKLERISAVCAASDPILSGILREWAKELRDALK